MMHKDIGQQMFPFCSYFKILNVFFSERGGEV